MPACDRFLDEHGLNDTCTDPQHREALARRRAGAAPWSTVQTGNDAPSGDPAGWRQFLDGKPIHCGQLLELQGREFSSDDYGEIMLLKPTGILVRYEVAWTAEAAPRRSREEWAALKAGGRVPMLHLSIDGYEFTKPLEDWMRFRWPERRR